MTTEDLLDRHYLPRYGSEQVGFYLHYAGELANADGAVTAQLLVGGTSTVVWTKTADHLGTGQYGVTLTGVDTQTPRQLDLKFSFMVNAVADLYVLYLEVGPAAPAYDALSAGYRAAVEAVWVRFADLVDSPFGGPHLATYVQAHFGRNRVAQLLRQAVGRLNTIGQPRQTYSLDADFPFEKWGPLLEQGLYVEVI